MPEYLTQLLLENYGPVGLFAIILWYRQGGIMRGLFRLAEESEQVDAEAVKEEVRIR
jgi:hypothetical protein